LGAGKVPRSQRTRRRRRRRKIRPHCGDVPRSFASWLPAPGAQQRQELPSASQWIWWPVMMREQDRCKAKISVFGGDRKRAKEGAGEPQ